MNSRLKYLSCASSGRSFKYKIIRLSRFLTHFSIHFCVYNYLFLIKCKVIVVLNFKDEMKTSDLWVIFLAKIFQNITIHIFVRQYKSVSVGTNV